MKRRKERPSLASVGLRLLLLTCTLLGMFAVFFGFVRPWYLRWGATDAEVRRALPGDEIMPNAASQQTRAITIHAPLNHVWPWLAQLGQDRGGFYSFDLLENLVGCRMPTDDRLRPDRQSWAVGDRLWMYPKEKGGGLGYATLHVYIPGHALGFGSRAMGAPADEPEAGSWSMVLEPIDSGSTRLLIRGRGAGGRSLLGVVFDRAAFEPMHYVMERRMMIGIRQLAEGSDRGRVANHIHVVLWTLTFIVFVAAFAGVLRRERWMRAWLALVLAGVVFAFLTLVQPPLLLGVALVVALTAFWCTGPPATHRSFERAHERFEEGAHGAALPHASG